MNDEAWDIFNSLDMKYVLIVFGGLAGYSSDDMNEFRWMLELLRKHSNAANARNFGSLSGGYR
ncbi:hypothetical protein Drorol1_Dr00016624, partial [Drosera rotundifolia]